MSEIGLNKIESGEDANGLLHSIKFLEEQLQESAEGGPGSGSVGAEKGYHTPEGIRAGVHPIRTYGRAGQQRTPELARSTVMEDCHEFQQQLMIMELLYRPHTSRSVKYVRLDLKKIQRTMMGALIVLDVHNLTVRPAATGNPPRGGALQVYHVLRCKIEL